ncbi:MAG: non-canonical purine NTP pyrophosphatase [Clostridiales bacterium]
MEILFATKKTEKKNYSINGLSKYGFKILSLNELSIDIDVEETGKTPSENAIKKAQKYFKASKIPTVSVDDGLYLEGFPQNKQPGTNVRRINGKRATDDDMLKYYTNEISKYGEKINGTWVKSIAIAIDDNKVFNYDFKVKKIFTSTIAKKRNDGYPLDSICITPEFNKYSVDLNHDEIKHIQGTRDKKVFEFIYTHLK